MKRNLKICIILIFLSILWGIKTNAQSTWTGNTPGTNYFLGYYPAADLTFGFGSGPTSYMQLNGITAPVGFLGIGLNFTTPQNLLHLNEFSATDIYTQFTNSTSTPPLTSTSGFKIGIDATGIAYLNQQENFDMIFNTSAIEHYHITYGTVPTLLNPSLGARIYTDNLDNFTISNLASTTGFGAFNPLTVFRVIGAGNAGGPLNILEVAEFRSTATDMQETAIKIRGERNTLTSMTSPPANSASIELSNYDDNEIPNPVDYIMAKVAAGMEAASGQTGNLSLWTNEGIANGGLQERVRVSSIGNVGIDLESTIISPPSPSNRLEINTTASILNPFIPTILPRHANSGATVLNGRPVGATGFSGLRFTDLRAESVPWSYNPGIGVLAVDSNGDVILLPNNIATTFNCPGPTLTN